MHNKTMELNKIEILQGIRVYKTCLSLRMPKEENEKAGGISLGRFLLGYLNHQK
jgi:hypothetical protein